MAALLWNRMRKPSWMWLRIFVEAYILESKSVTKRSPLDEW